MQVFDLFPTLLELASVKEKNTHFAKSLVPQLMGASGDPDRVVYAEAGFMYPTEMEPLHSGDVTDPSDKRNKDYPRYQEELEGYSNITVSQPNFKECRGSPRATMVRTSRYKLV